MRPLIRCALVASLASCRPAHKAIQDLPPEVILHGVTLRQFHGGRLTAHGRADQLNYQRGTTDYVATTAEVHFHSEHGASAVVTAPRVSGNLNNRQADGSGGVSMRTDDGRTGHTERAHFDGNAMVVSGSDPVELADAAYRTRGSAFHFQLREQIYELSDVTTQLEAQR